jgi:uncharacterized protein YndB with AHSA1/START domain
MTTVTNDNEIRCEMILKASPAKVWSALTTPEGWTGWFSHGVEGKFEVVEPLILDFGPYGEVKAFVAEKEEQKAFAYKWHPGETDSNDTYLEEEMTTVRFTLEPEGEGTKLVMTETGFVKVPEHRRSRVMADNTGGWNHELAKIVPLVEQDERQAKLPFDIYRDPFYSAPIQAVWNAIATADGLAGWFVQEVEGSLTPGSMATFHFGNGISGPIQVLERIEPTLFSFKWHPGEDQGCTWDKYPESETTTVKFELSEKDGGTKVVITESGFDNIPEPRRSKALKGNKGGWSQVKQMIGDYLAKNS